MNKASHYYPDKFESKREGAKFNLGLSGSVYYPATPKGISPSFVIDFGHPDFYFTEDSRKSLKDFQ